MKKIVLSVLVIVFLVFLSLTAFAGPHRSIFSNSTSTLFFDGAIEDRKRLRVERRDRHAPIESCTASPGTGGDPTI